MGSLGQREQWCQGTEGLLEQGSDHTQRQMALENCEVQSRLHVTSRHPRKPRSTFREAAGITDSHTVRACLQVMPVSKVGVLPSGGARAGEAGEPALSPLCSDP